MASNKFAESVINGTYKKNNQEENTMQNNNTTQNATQNTTQNTTQTSNNFAESVINGTYKSPKTIETKKEIATTPTRTYNADALTDGVVDKNKVFSNGYQPNNITDKTGNYKLSSTGKTVGEVFGEGQLYGNSGANLGSQQVWRANGKYYVWDGSQNKYVDVSNVLKDSLTSGSMKAGGNTITWGSSGRAHSGGVGSHFGEAPSNPVTNKPKEATTQALDEGNGYLSLDGLHISKDSYNNTYNRVKTQRQAELDAKAKQWKEEEERDNAGFFTRALNTVGDVASDFGEGFMGTLEGMTDWGTYRLADLSDLIGQEEWAENLRKNADFDSTGTLFGKNQNVQENIFGNWTAPIEKYSYSPELVDQVFQGVGNVGAMAAVTAVTGGGALAADAGKAAKIQAALKQAAISYTSAYGNARSEAIRNGASASDANKYGMINGIAEALSEQFFSGMPGTKVAGWGDKVSDAVSAKVKKYFGTKAGKVALVAMDGLGEGSEELISNLIQYVGNELADSEYGKATQSSILNGDQFLSAFLTSALLGSGKAVLDTKAQNNIIKAYAQDNNMSFDDAKTQLLQFQEQAQKQQTNEQPIEQQQTPQIQTNEENNINNQPVMEQPQIEPKQANNEEMQSNVEKTGQDIKQEWLNGFDQANNLEGIKEQSIANDSNTFNLGKANENTTLRNIRTKEDISSKSTNAYQFDNPEVKPFFLDAAYDLKNALENNTTKGERWMREDGTWDGTKFSSTPEITKLKEDYNMSYKEIDKGIEGIIKDEGQENNAASKKVELVIDDMLRNGYKSATPDTVKPNQNYLNALSGKQVENNANEQVDEELPFFTGDEKVEQQEPTEQPTNNNLAETKTDDVIKAKLTPQQEEQHFIDNGVEPKVAKILAEMPKPDKKSLSEKIKEGKATLREEWSYFKRNFVDKGETIYRLAKELKNKVLYPKYDKIGTTRGEANFSIEKGQTDLNGKKFNNFTDKNGKKTSMSLNQIWKGIDVGAANQYLAHWLNIDRYNQLTQEGQNKYVFGTPDINPEISKARIAELEQEHPELKRFGENIWQYGKNMLQNMVDSGLVNKQQAEQFMQETPHYVRLQRNIETNQKTAAEVKNGKIEVNKPTKYEFKGSDLDILPFKNSMAEYTFDVAKAMRINLFAQELAKAMSVNSTDGSVSSLDESFGVKPELLRDNGNGTYSLTLFNNGVATVIPIDEGIYEALTPNKHYKFEDRLAFKAIRKIDSFRKALLTEKNPMFLATNMMKDLFDAPLNSKYPVEFAKNYPRAIKEVATNGKYYQQYQALGGLQNSYFEKGEFKKQGSKLNPLNWIEKGNNAIEQFPRLAEFISTMEKTGDVDQAMYNAAEITTNFKRGGDVAKAANRNGVTFLNASIQGFDKQIRNFTDAFSKSNGKLNVDKKQVVKLLGKIVVLGIAPALINDMMYSDDKEYEEMQDYIKDRYYLIKLGGGQWIRIPKGRAVSVFQSAARRTSDALDGEENAFKGFANFASTQVAPNNPFENNIISPIVDVARNESWSGNKIVSDSMAKRPEAEQWNEKTDEFSKWLGGALNVSPMKINYLIDQYSGAIGDVLLPMNTAKSTSVTDNPILQPWADKFTTDAVYSNKNVSDFYDKEREYEKKRYSINATEEDKIKYKYLYNAGLQMADLRKEQSAIQSDSSLSKSEKYEKARKIQEEINELSKKAVEDLDTFEDNDYYATIGDSIYYLDDDGTFKKDSYAESHQKSADKKGMALYDYYKQQYEKRKEKNSK